MLLRPSLAPMQELRLQQHATSALFKQAAMCAGAVAAAVFVDTINTKSGFVLGPLTRKSAAKL
jgi:hypothetical protein